MVTDFGAGAAKMALGAANTPASIVAGGALAAKTSAANTNMRIIGSSPFRERDGR